jgi:LmbE family N-acetylglucosaminyl deacetylase
MIQIILLAHADDEVFFAPFFANSAENYLVYLTNGVSHLEENTLTLQRRMNETRLAFEKNLKKYNTELVHLGNLLKIPEGQLHLANLNECVELIVEFIHSRNSTDIQLLTTTFEGAHQDHDSAAIISRRISKICTLPIKEISTYRQRLKNCYSFTVMNPTSRREKIVFNRWAVTILSIKIMFSYKTQWKTWTGLSLGVILRYLRGHYFVAEQIKIGTHDKCFYSYRKRASQAEVIAHLTRFESEVA